MRLSPKLCRTVHPRTKEALAHDLRDEVSDALLDASQRCEQAFAGHIREKPRERNSVRTRILYEAIEKANKLLAVEDRRRCRTASRSIHCAGPTALRAELGEHPAITAAQMRHRDPRMTLRVYTDVTGMRPRTRLGGLLGNGDWITEDNSFD